MSEAVEQLEDEENETPKKGANLRALESAIESSWRPDLYRCKGCQVTVDDRSRAGHLGRCPSPASSSIEEAFELRPRPSVAAQARTALGGQLKQGRRRRRIEKVHHLSRELEAEAFTPDPEFDEEPLFPSAETRPRKAQPAPSLAEQVGIANGQAESLAPASPPPKENQMSNATMTTPEVAELLGVDASSVRLWVKQKKIKPVIAGRAGVPATFDRADVLKLKTARASDEAPPVQAAKKPRRLKRPPAKAARRLPAAELDVGEGGLREDVIMLVRCVDRGFMSEPEAFAKLREISEQL